MLLKIYKKNFIVAMGIIFVLLYSAALFRLGMYFGGAAAQQLYQNVSSPRYIVREYGGKIAVFEYGSDVPQKILNIEVSHLRRYDRQKFEQGITLNSLAELSCLEEDFSG